MKFVFADGVERVVKPLNKKQLDAKMKQDDFEGKVYKGMYELIEKNYDKIKAAKPQVSKIRQAITYGMFGTAKRACLI